MAKGFAWIEQLHDGTSLGSDASRHGSHYSFDAVVVVIQSFVINTTSRIPFKFDRNGNVALILSCHVKYVYSYLTKNVP